MIGGVNAGGTTERNSAPRPEVDEALLFVVISPLSIAAQTLE